MDSNNDGEMGWEEEEEEDVNTEEMEGGCVAAYNFFMDSLGLWEKWRRMRRTSYHDMDT